MGKVEKPTYSITGGPVFLYFQDGWIIRLIPMEFGSDDARPGPRLKGGGTHANVTKQSDKPRHI